MLDHIFKYAPGVFITVWAKNETGSITRWFDLSEADAMDQAQQVAIGLDARGYDVYFSTCPARSSSENGTEKARIKAADVACVPAFFMDIDTLLDGSKLGKRLPAGVTEAVTALDALCCPPTICVSSGHGLHAYWVCGSGWPLPRLRAWNRQRSFSEVLRTPSCRRSALRIATPTPVNRRVYSAWRGRATTKWDNCFRSRSSNGLNRWDMI